MTSQPHFDINAAVVKQLGEELVSDEVTAIIELVKNAYDADASYANVVVDSGNLLEDEELYFSEKNGYAPTGGYVTIEDDGIGMSRSEIEKGWLTISFSQKRIMAAEGRLTPKKRRAPLGHKGLGRLSTQRLGHRLEMFTHRERIAVQEARAQHYDIDDKQQNIEHHVAFDWHDFTEDVNLTAVPVYFQSKGKETPRQGTKLVITGLQEPQVWLDDTRRNALVRQISQLIFPFAEVRPFEVYLTIDGARVELAKIAESLRDVAVSRFQFAFDEGRDWRLRIRGKIRLTRLKGIGEDREEQYNQLLARDQGGGFYAFLTDPDNRFRLSAIEYLEKGGWYISYEDTLECASIGGLAMDGDVPANPGRFHGEIDEFFFRGVNLDPVEDVFSRVADYKNAVGQHIGVRIYRDGFGIRPYGLDGSDWLNLGGGQTSGLSFYPPRPQNVIGYVALTAKENGRLKEKTDREGFIESPYSRNFFLIMEQFKDKLEVLYSNLGRSYNEYRKRHAEASPEFRSLGRFAPEARRIAASAQSVQTRVDNLDSDLDTITTSVQGIVDRATDTPLLASPEERVLSPLLSDASEKLRQASGLVQELRSLLDRLRVLEPTVNSLEARIGILEDQLAQFSELAGLGMTAEALSHEIHTVVDMLAERTKTLKDHLRRLNIVDAAIIAYTEYVYSAISALRKQLSHLAPSLRYVRDRKDRIHLHDFFLDLQEYYSAGRFKRSGIQMVLEEPFDDFVILINRGKLTQVVDNLILNSEYWLREATRRRDVTEPRITVRSKRPLVAICDNGVGVDPSIESSLFQPFVTTKPRSLGRGLGLFVVRELLDSSGCAISLLPDRNEFGKRYVLQIDFTGAIDEQ